MPTYEYRCTHGHVWNLYTSMDDEYSRHAYEGVECGELPEDDEGDNTAGCDGFLRRVFSFAPAPVMHEHWNTAVGKPISSMTEFKSELARSSDVMAERLGHPVNYVPVDMGDKSGLGVTDEGLQVYDRPRSRSDPPPAERARWLAPLPAPAPGPAPPAAPTAPSPPSLPAPGTPS